MIKEGLTNIHKVKQKGYIVKYVGYFWAKGNSICFVSHTSKLIELMIHRTNDVFHKTIQPISQHIKSTLGLTPVKLKPFTLSLEINIVCLHNNHYSLHFPMLRTYHPFSFFIPLYPNSPESPFRGGRPNKKNPTEIHQNAAIYTLLKKIRTSKSGPEALNVNAT